jgi:pyruvate/2-oxoglutarate dehydrogenase complex dihydrolipoamide dehydrogenase (E3) component
MQSYDAIIIGAGQAAVPLSVDLARAGWKTALVEAIHVGGTCINEGCTPTKTMVASAEAAYRIQRSASLGVLIGQVWVDMGKIRARKDAIVAEWRESSRRRVESSGADLIFGEARFTGPDTIEVAPAEGGDPLQLQAPKIIIDAGSRPALPPLEGLDSVPLLNSTTVMELDEVPEHLIVLGGGYVAVEFGQMFRRFGSRVTLVERSERLMLREDPDISDGILKILTEDGLQVLLQARATKVEPGERGGVRLNVQTPQGPQRLEGSHLLVATGRQPNSDRLNLPAAGIETDSHGFIRTNDRLETSVAGIYAVGDIKGGPAFTHISYDDYRILKTNLLEGGHASIHGRQVPYAVFIDPQLGRIGLSEQEARRQGLDVRVAAMPMEYVARAAETGQLRGFMKAVVDAGSGQILGAAILGVDGGEIMAMIQIAMLGKLHYRALKDAIFAHPTLAESLNNLFARLDS